MLKVVHLITSAARSQYLCSIADHTSRMRFEIIIATLSPAGDLHKDMGARGIQSFAFGCTRRSNYPLVMQKLAFWLRKKRVNILQTHLFDASFIGLLAARIARTPLTILTRHHSNAVILTGKRLPMLVDLVSSRYLAHRVIVPSEKTRQVILMHEGVLPDKVAVIPYGFDFEKIQCTKNARQRIRNELSLNGSTVLATVGRLDPLKGHAHLFNAIAKLIPTYPDLKLLVVGDGPEREHLTSLCDSLGLSREIIFTGYRHDVFDVMSAADALVHTSLAEAFSQAIAEAVALSKPVVATDVGGTRELVKDGASGFVVTPGEVNRLYEGLLKLLQSRDRWQEMGELGRLRVQQFSAERMVNAYEEHYINWLKEREFLS